MSGELTWPLRRAFAALLLVDYISISRGIVDTTAETNISFPRRYIVLRASYLILPSISHCSNLQRNKDAPSDPALHILCCCTLDLPRSFPSTNVFWLDCSILRSRKKKSGCACTAARTKEILKQIQPRFRLSEADACWTERICMWLDLIRKLQRYRTANFPRTAVVFESMQIPPVCGKLQS